MGLVKGDRLGPYEILAPVGAGGMGEVYKARDTRLKREVAVKVLSERLGGDASALARFEREAMAVAALSHPNILAIHDFGHEGDVTYAVMELLEGETLRERLNRGALPASKATDIAAQIAKGMAAAHEKGIVHRDLKPANVFLTKDGQVKILDFGLAKVEAPAVVLESGVSQEITAEMGTSPGAVMGTIGYMAPEQARGHPADARSDIFSFGVVLYEMLSGKRAFKGDTASDTLAAILTKDPDPLPPVTPPGVDHVVRRCLEKKPEDRFSSAHDLILALEVASTHSAPPMSEPAVAMTGARRWSARNWAMAGAIVLLLTLAAMGLWLWKGKPSKPAAGTQTQTIKAIALYPLDDLSGDPGQAYFAPGMTDALTTKLTQIRSLKVSGSVSAARCKEEKMPLPKVAEVLGVDAVVMGSVVRVGDTVRISVRLVEARTDSNLWADSYERKLSDVLVLQGEVAQAIAASVRATVSPEEKAKLAGRAVDARAYDEYLAGLYEFREMGSKEHLLTAIAHFKKAVELDPGFAAPYSKLIEVYGQQWFCSFITFEEAYAPAKAAALKVVEVAPSDAGTHAALANFMYSFERDLRGAESESRKAMELDDRAPNVGLTYGMIWSLLGRDEEAIRVLRKVVELDPMNLLELYWLDMAYMMAGRWDEGARCMDKYLELSTESAFSYAMAGFVCVAAGDREKGLAYAKKARALPGWDTQYVSVGNLACTYAMLGQRQEALQMLRLREPLCIGNQMEETDLGQLYAWLGERDRAFQHLEKGCSMRGWATYQIGWWWLYPKEFRKDPRYIALVKKVGLPVRDENGKVIGDVSRGVGE